jgi:hypothetical protein
MYLNKVTENTHAICNINNQIKPNYVATSYMAQIISGKRGQMLPHHTLILHKTQKHNIVVCHV